MKMELTLRQMDRRVSVGDRGEVVEVGEAEQSRLHCQRFLAW